MTDKNKIEKIAQIIGYGKSYTFISQEFETMGQEIQTWITPDNKTNVSKLPDFLNDLNAMHEAEKFLDGPDINDPNSLRYRYSHAVYQLVPAEQQPFRSTARQRADAFLTLFP